MSDVITTRRCACVTRTAGGDPRGYSEVSFVQNRILHISAMGQRSIPRAQANSSLTGFVILSIDETSTHHSKFCPRAIWLNVWMSRAKNTFIDFGIRLY